MRIIYYLNFIISIAILLLSFMLIVMPVSLIAWPFKNPSKRIKISGPFWVLFFNIILKFVTRSKVLFIDRRNELDKKLCPTGLYICNHQSFMDIPLTFSHFAIAPIMKKELVYIPFFGIACYASGALLVDRKTQKSRLNTFERATRRLKGKNGRLLYYPEGTRSKNSDGPKDASQIKTKIIEHAFNEKIPVTAASIYGTKWILNKNGTINFNKKIGLILHKALNPKDFASKEEFVSKAWELVHEGYKELEAKLI